MDEFDYRPHRCGVHPVFFVAVNHHRRGVEIFANNVLKGNTKINKGVVLKENNIIEDSLINEDCEIICSVLKNTTIESGQQVGPFKVIQGE